MECGLCGTLNRDLARFCGGCGAPMGRVCPTCKSEIDAGLRFCDQCGTEVDATPVAAVPEASADAGSAPEAVRKTVTVLFADLGGSTGFGERTDPEIARQVLARYHAMLQQAIDAHGGTVAKFMGDGMMATFGVPEVAEDDAERAVRAGIEIQDRFARFAADISTRYGETLTARVGVNTGEIVIGAADADLVGDALNVAARLEKACRPGHVLVGEETWRVTRGVLAYEPLGEVTVAGREQPVGTYQVSAVERRAAEPVAAFVGREGELARLRVAFDRAVADRSAVLVTVLGSPGLGKTRLSREFLAGLDATDAATTFEIRCDRAGMATFAPVADLVRAAAGLGDAETEEGARERLSSLLDGIEDVDRVVDGLVGVLGVAALRSVEETFWSVRRGVEALAFARPLVVVIDDIQWAEPKLLDLAEHLQEWVSEAPVLLVGLARPELRELRPTFVEPGRRVADVLALDGLDARATEELAARLLGSALPRELVDRLPVSTDGNPLFVRELVRMLVDDRVIVRRDDGEWDLAIDAEAVEVPPTIQSLLATRVERLPAEELRVLECASVVGAEFSVGALRELVGDGPDVPLLLERLRRRELVEPTGSYWGDEPVHRFHHVLIRDAAYRRLLKGARAELHQRVGEWTDASAVGAAGEHEITVAFHYEQAHRYRTELGTTGDATDRLGARAAELLEIAARRALEGDDLAAAGALARRALAVLPEADPGTRSSLLLVACESLLASGDVVAGAPLVGELSERAGSDPRLAAWADCFRAQLVGLTEPEGLVEAEALAAQAAITLDALDDGAGEAKAHQVRALLLARLGRVGEAEAVLDLALGAARAADDRRRVTAVLGAAPQAALFGPSPVARAGGRCLDVVRLLRITTASPSVEATSMRCQAVLEALRGRFDVSRSMLASSRTALEELGLRHGLLETDLFTGMVELIAGDTAAAVAPLRAAYEGLGTLGVGADAGQAAALLATALLAQGEVDEAELMAAESEALAGQNLKTAIAWRTAKAQVLAARGDLEPAVALARDAVEIAAGTDLVLDHADACVVLADLCDATGDAAGSNVARADALRLYEAKGATVPAERLHGPVEAQRDEPPEETPSGGNSPHPAPLENAATRNHVEVCDAINRRDDATQLRLVAREFVQIDRRPLVGLEDRGRRGMAEYHTVLLDQGFLILPPEPIAIRGDRLALCRVLGRTPAGDESVLFALNELDEHGLMVRHTVFAESDVAAAFDELNGRYRELEREAAVVLLAGDAMSRAYAMRDWDAYRAVLSDAFRFVDHRRMGFGTAGPDAFVGTVRSTTRTVPEVETVRSVVTRGRAMLFAAEGAGEIPDGGPVEWVRISILHVDAFDKIDAFEWFDEDDWDTALARLDALGAEVPTEPRTPPVANAAADAMAHVIDLCHERRFDALRTMLTDDFAREDRRHGVAAPTADGPDEFVRAYAAWFDVGFDTLAMESLAVRGDAIVLAHLEWESGDGRKVGFLALYELAPDGRFRRGVHFDDGDLLAALAELDARYYAGEGAEHAEVGAHVAAWGQAFVARDWAACAALLADGFVAVSHFQFGFELGAAEYLGWLRTTEEQMPGLTVVPYRVAVVGRAVLDSDVVAAVTPEDSEYGWRMHLVTVAGADGRIVRHEYFEDDQYAMAVTRLHELGAVDPAGPESAVRPVVDNAAVRSQREFVTAVNAYLERGDFAEVARVAIATDDFVVEDRRSIVAMPDQDEGAVADVLATFRAQGYVHVSDEPVAMRGEHLCLTARTWTTRSGDETRSLTISEHDEHGRIRRAVLHDGDALEAALDDLDERYLAGEGVDHLDVLIPCVRFRAASLAGDFDALHDVMAPDFAFADHRRLGFGSGDRDYYLAASRTRTEVAADGPIVNRLVVVDGTALLTLQTEQTSTPEGSEYERGAYVVMAVDGSGRIGAAEWFDEDCYGDAVVRLHELGGPPAAGPVLSNRAVHVLGAILAGLDAGDLDVLGGLLAETLVHEDRRPVVGEGRLDGRAAMVANLTAIAELDARATIEEVVAIRGDRLVLARVVHATEDGFEIAVLEVVGVDERGRVVEHVVFDPEDLDAALDELDGRFLAGEGTEHAFVVQRIGDFRHARAARDWDAVADLVAADYVAVDRRHLGMGQGTRDDYLAASKAMVELVPDATFVPRTIEVEGDVVLMRTAGSGTSVDGSRSEWEQRVVWRFAAGRVVRGEVFGLEDGAAARARFTELAAETLTPYVDNRLVRLSERARWRARHAGAAPDIYGADCVLDDRRSGVNAGLVTGGAAVAASIWSGVDVFGLLEAQALAVRGERLALLRWAYVHDGGFEAPGLCVLETGDDELVARITSFDEADLAAAIDFLEDRHAALRGVSLTWIERVAAEGERSLNHRDFDAFAPLLAGDFRVVDHRRLGMPMDRDEYLESLRVLIDQAPDFTFVFAKLHVEGDVAITSVPFFGTTPEGNRYKWSYVQIAVGDPESARARVFEFFDDDQWDLALARFEQLVDGIDAAPASVELRTPDPENATTRLVAEVTTLLWRDLDAALGYFAPDVVGFARESGPTAGASAEEPARWLDVLTSLVATYDAVRFEPLAVRGERLALFRQEFVAHGFVTPALLVVELDEHERISRLETFADDDLAGAAQLLTDRDVVLRGPDLTLPERYLADAYAAWRRQDFAAFAETMEPGFVRTDRGPIGMGVEDRDAYVADMRVLATQVPGLVPCPAKVYASDRAVITMQHTRGTTGDGSELAWDVAYVIRVGPSGRAVEMVTFDAVEWDEALALFDAWSAEPDAVAPAPEDLVGRTVVAAYRALNRRDWDELEAYLADDLAIVDHRTLGFPPGTGGIALRSELQRLVEQVPDVVAEVTAIESDGLVALVTTHQSGTTDSGTAVAWDFLTVVAVDPNRGLIVRHEYFDPDDRAGAETRFDDLGSESDDDDGRLEDGPVDDEPGLAAEALWSVLDRHDLAVLDRIVTPSVTFTDHLANGLTSVRSASALAKVFARLYELAPDTRFTTGPVSVLGVAAMLDVEQRSTAPSGTQYRWDRVVVVGCAPDGRIDGVECFAQSARVDAAERLREWSGINPATDSERVLADGVSAAFARRDWDWIRAQISDDIELRDHRSTVSSHVASGADAVIALLRGFADVGFVTMRNEVVEARGDRRVLFRRTYRTAAGFELVMLAGAERDEAGKIVGMVLFDADDLDAARAELDRRRDLTGD